MTKKPLRSIVQRAPGDKDQKGPFNPFTSRDEIPNPKDNKSTTVPKVGADEDTWVKNEFRKAKKSGAA